MGSLEGAERKQHDTPGPQSRSGVRPSRGFSRPDNVRETLIAPLHVVARLQNSDGDRGELEVAVRSRGIQAHLDDGGLIEVPRKYGALLPSDLQTGKIAVEVPVQIERSEMELSAGWCAETWFGGHGGEAEIATRAEDTGQDLAIPISQPISRGLSSDGKDLIDLSIQSVFHQIAGLDLKRIGGAGCLDEHRNRPDHQFR